MYKRLLGVVFTSFLIASCSSSPTKPNGPFHPYSSATVVQPYVGKKVYKLGTVDVILSKAVFNPKFPDQDALNQVFIEKLNRQLSESNLVGESQSEALTLNVNIRYKRIFYGEAFGMNSSFAGSTFSYSSDLLVNGTSVGTFSHPEVRVSKMTLSGTPKDEERDIDTYVNKIVDDLPR